MSISATVQLDFTAYGDGKDYTNIVQESNTTSPLQIQRAYPFATGENTLTKPTGATKILIENVTGVLHLLGETGDTGWLLTEDGCAYFNIDTAVTAVLFNAASGATADLTWI